MRDSARDDVLCAARHAMLWLVVGNAVGLWLALLLLFPQLNFGSFNYGRLVPVHLNVQLYGWSSLPLVAWLLHLFKVKDQSELAAGRAAVLAWSLALAMGVMSWLFGQNSGKIFLEWTGVPRTCFPAVLLFLWAVLASRWFRQPDWLRGLGLACLLPVPLLWYWAASPHVYPAIDPSTAGPTGASLLGSTLGVVLLLLLAAPVLGTRVSRRWTPVIWITFAVQIVIFVFADKGNSSHRSLEQIAVLGSLLAWILLMPLYFRDHEFPMPSRGWLNAMLAWFGFLTLTGWLSFLPRALDALKFTNGLVAHSHLAMAGFVTSLNLFLMSAMLNTSISGRAAAWLWNIAAFGYVVLMWIAGVFEAGDPGFTTLPGSARTLLYSSRALCGFLMLACSIIWARALMGSLAREHEGMPLPEAQLLAA